MAKIKVKVMLDKGAIMPTKAHKTDAGYDVYAPNDVPIRAGQSAICDIGVHMLIPKGYVGMIKSKSGLNVKQGLVAEGVIDAGYTGSVVVKLYNHSDKYYCVKKGEKLTQIVILPIPDVELEEVESFENTERGANGFGSSGK